MKRATPRAGERPVMRPCPSCGTAVPWGPESPFRPFCSERCRSIDLGAWLTESYRIPSEEPEDPDDPGAASDSGRKPA